VDFLATSNPAEGVGLLAALLAGIVSFLSPCVSPLVPGHLSAVTGVSIEDIEDAGWRRVLVPSAGAEPVLRRELLADLHLARPQRDEDRLDPNR
jgi:cytochrome c-type biogenesis protein